MRYLFFIFIFISPYLKAQLSSGEQKRVDSLQRVISSARHDSIAIQAIFSWAEITENTDPEFSLKLMRQIDSICNLRLGSASGEKEKYVYQQAQARVLFVKGKIQLNRGEMKEAEKLLKQSSALYGRISDSSEMLMRVYGELGNCKKSSGEYDSALVYFNKAIRIAQRLRDQESVSVFYSNFGMIYTIQSDYEQALIYFNKSIQIDKMMNNAEGIGINLNYMAEVYNKQGNIKKAIDCYLQGLKLFEDLGDEKWIAAFQVNTGVVYMNQNENEKAIEYFEKGRKTLKRLGFRYGEGIAMANLGIIHLNDQQYDKALGYLFPAYQMNTEGGNDFAAAEILKSIGEAFNGKGETDSALVYLEQSRKICEKRGFNGVLGEVCTVIGQAYFKRGEYSRALEMGKKGLDLLIETENTIGIDDAAFSLYEIYKQMKRYRESLEMHELYLQTRDSIMNEENQREVIRQQFDYEYSKQAAADSVRALEEKKVKDAEIAGQQIEIAAQKKQQYMLSGGLLMVMFFALLSYRRYKISQKQKKIIEEQKQIVEEKNKEITDSINYAKRIQAAILPPDRLVKTLLPESFVLYKPKDIVAGDFYWIQVEGEADGKQILFAAADCTGHGVPGAMVSVVCNNGLNRAVREYGLRDPGQILDKTREIVIAEFEKSEDEVKDGMDISLCVVKGNQLQWAGANNPLWIIRKNTAGHAELTEIKGDKQPIGKYADARAFTTHTLELLDGDMIYVFTDGFADQFGGDKGKKFKSANLKTLLLSLSDKDPQTQKQEIENAFESWKLNLEQNDDVCVIGMRYRNSRD